MSSAGRGLAAAATVCCLLVALTPPAESFDGHLQSAAPLVQTKDRALLADCRDVLPGGHRYVDGQVIPNVLSWCCPDTELGPYGLVDWPTTRLYRIAEAVCPYGPRIAEDGIQSHGVAKAYRQCVFSNIIGPKWEMSNYSACKKQGDDEVKAAEDANKAANLTSDPKRIDKATFLEAAHLIADAHAFARTNRTVARDLLQAISNLVATAPEVQRDSDADGSQRRKLFYLMEEHGRTVVLRDGEASYEHEFANLQLSVRRMPLSAAGYPDMHFAANFGRGWNDSTTAAGGGPLSLRLPAEALRQAADAVSDTRTELRVRFVAVRNAELLAPPGRHSGLQQVVTASISLAPRSEEEQEEQEEPQQLDVAVVALADPVRIQMPFAKVSWGATHLCAYYDRAAGEWKTDGVTLRMDASENPTCESRHLTPFTILLDPYPREGLGDMVGALDLVGYVGSALSVLGLTLTIITYQFCSRFGGDRWGRVLVQLCLSLLLLHLSYLASNFKGTLPPLGCVAVAVAVHLFLLAAFCWMLVEALLLYELLVTVFQSANTKFVMKRLLFAWGTPVALVLVCGSVNPHYYLDTHPDYCVVSGVDPVHHGLATLLPCGLIMVANICIFVRVAYVLLQRRSLPGSRFEPEKPSVSWAKVRGVIGVAFLLGVTWPLSPLAVNAPLLQMAASALNASQGVAIFVSRVLTHPEARRFWKQRLCPMSPEFRTSSASYHVSNKSTSWFRFRSSVTSSSVASPPTGKVPKSSGWCNPWTVLVTPRSRDSVMTSKSSSDTDILY